MKYRELHRIIRKSGWVALPKKGKGSHVRYVKNVSLKEYLTNWGLQYEKRGYNDQCGP